MKYPDYQLMSKEQKNKIMPKLRFPEFQNKEWKETTLGAIAVLIDERAGANDYTLMSVTSGIGLVPQKEKFGREIAGNQYKNYFVIKKWDFAYNKSATKLYPEGYISMLKNFESAAVPNSIFTCFRITDNKTNPQFLDFIFHDNFHGKWLRKFIEVGARAHGSLSVDMDALFNMPIALPSLEEQQKIASCLSSLDDLITAHTQKLEALKAYKKGLMQQLFPAEGEKVPRLRFMEFRDSGEWILTPLKEAFTIFQGFAFQSIDSVPQGVRWLKIADVGILQMNHNAPSYLPTEFAEKYKNFLVEKGDYVIALTRPILSGDLKIAQVDDVFHKSLLNQRVGKLISTENISFVYYLLQTSTLVANIEKNITGSEPPNLSAQQIEDIKVYTPITKDEQQKVVEILSSLDELIAAQAEKIAQLKRYKKGLMLGLFPVINESN